MGTWLNIHHNLPTIIKHVTKGHSTETVIQVENKNKLPNSKLRGKVSKDWGGQTF